MAADAAPTSSKSLRISDSVSAYLPSPKCVYRTTPSWSTKVLGRPETVFVALPDGEIIVLHHRPGHLVVLGGLHHVFIHFLEMELRRVDADYDQTVVGVAFVPSPQVGKRADAVDAGISPEINQHDLASQPFHREWAAVDPLLGAGELRCAVANLAAPGPLARRWGLSVGAAVGGGGSGVSSGAAVAAGSGVLAAAAGALAVAVGSGAAVAGGSGVLAAATGALAVAVGFAALVASGAAAASGTVVASGDDGAAVASGDETGPLESDEPPQATARRTKDTAIAAKNTSLGTGFRPPAALVKIRYNCYSLRVPDSLHLRPDPQRRRDGAGLRQGTGRGPRPGTRLLNLNYEWPMVLDAYSFILHRAPASMTLSGRGGLL